MSPFDYFEMGCDNVRVLIFKGSKCILLPSNIGIYIANMLNYFLRSISHTVYIDKSTMLHSIMPFMIVKTLHCKFITVSSYDLFFTSRCFYIAGRQIYCFNTLNPTIFSKTNCCENFSRCKR